MRPTVGNKELFIGFMQNNMKIETVNLTKVYVNDKNKEGKAFITKNNKPYWKIAIQTDVYGERWISDLIFDPEDVRRSWKVGDQQNIIVEEENEYLNFRMPEEKDMMMLRLDDLERRVKMLEELP